ncbi:MAG: SLC13 family permease [Anaerobutyricum sp.]|nr:SLC13 family permease [Anaerobutyricum sp.]
MKKYKDLICLIIASLIVLAFLLINSIGTLGTSATRLIGIFIGTVFLWITIGISWPSLFGMLALAFLIPEVSMKDMISGSVGNPAITFLIFTFCCSYALNQTSFTKRVAIWFLSVPAARTKPLVFVVLYFCSVLALGSFMSSTVIVLIYLTINDEIFHLLHLHPGDSFAKMMTAGLVITASISGAMTPIAHVFPIVALSTYKNISGSNISYAEYMAGGIPAALISVICMTLILMALLHPNLSILQNLDMNCLKKDIKPADRRERAITLIFLGVVVLWVLPDLLKNVSPTFFGKINDMGTAMPSMLGTLLLCVLQADGKPLLDFRDGLKSVPWDCLFMAASALALGSAISNKDIGLSTFISTQLEPVIRALSGIALVFILILITGIMTNIGSNMVTVTIVCTVALPIAIASGSVNAAALAAVLGMASSYAFATPPAMTTVPLGISSGWITATDMAKYGFMVLVPCILSISCIAYPIIAMVVR